MPVTRPVQKFSLRSLVPAAIILAITLIAYAPALRAGFIWDDDDYVTNNPNLRSIEGLRDTWFSPRSLPQYYPLVHTSFWIEYHLWDLQAAGYHAINILLHACAAMLLWRLLVALEIPGAFLAAALFAVHPINVESVAWVTERKNVLSALFYFASALMYWKWSTCENDRKHYVLALAFFIAALLSKTVTCSLPAALLLILWWKRRRIARRDILALIPFFILGIGFAIMTARLEVHHVRAIGREWDYSFLQRLLIAGQAIWFYLITLALPLNLTFVYPKWNADAHDALQYAWALAASLVVFALFILRKKIGRAPLVAALIFIGTLFPALGFFNIYPMRYTFVADHYAYHAAAAIFVLLAVGIDRLLTKLRIEGYLRCAVYAAILMPCVFLTLQRTRIYENALTLWRDTLAKNPNSWMVHLNLAKSLAAAGDEPRARHHFEEALALGQGIPETHWNMGIAHARAREFDRALAEYDQALALDPTLAQARFGKANVYLQQENLTAARDELQRAIDTKPDYAEAYFNLGIVLEKLQDLPGAIRSYEFAIALRPDYAKAHLNLAHILAQLGRGADAREEYNRAIQLDPSLAP